MNLYLDESSERFFLKDRMGDNSVYVDSSLYKANGNAGKIYIFGDSQTGGMKSYLRSYYRNLGYADSDIIINIKNGAKYHHIADRIAKNKYNQNDQIVIGSLGGPEAEHARYINQNTARIDPLIRRLQEHRDRGVGVVVFGNPRGGNKLKFENRKTIDRLQGAALKGAGINYVSVYNPSTQIKALSNNVHYGGNYKKYFNRLLSPSLGGTRIGPATTGAVSRPTAPMRSTPVPAPSSSIMGVSKNLSQWDNLVTTYSKKYNVPRAWLYSTMSTESGGNPNSGIKRYRSLIQKYGKGSKEENFQGIGLMQIIPSSFKNRTRSMRNSGFDAPWDENDVNAILDPETNINVAAYSLRKKIDRAQKMYPITKTDHRLLHNYVGIMYFKGDGTKQIPNNRNKYLKIAQKNNPTWSSDKQKRWAYDPANWELDPTSKTGHVRKRGASYAAKSYKKYKKYQSSIGGPSGSSTPDLSFKYPKGGAKVRVPSSTSVSRTGAVGTTSKISKQAEAARARIRKLATSPPPTTSSGSPTKTELKTQGEWLHAREKFRTTPVWERSLSSVLKGFFDRSSSSSRFTCENFIQLNGE